MTHDNRATRNLQCFVDEVWLTQPIAAGRSTGSLGVDLSQAARLGAAIAATDPAAAKPLHLPGRNLAACEAHLAHSLSNLSLRLADVGRPTAAVATAEHAVESCIRLAAKDPEAHSADFASSLINLGLLLAQMGRRDKALAVSRCAVSVLDRTSTSAIACSPTRIAASLRAFAWIRATMTLEIDDALTAIRRAITIYTVVAGTDNSTFRTDLQSANTIQATLLEQLDQPEDARSIRQGSGASSSITPVARRRIPAEMEIIHSPCLLKPPVGFASRARAVRPRTVDRRTRDSHGRQ